MRLILNQRAVVFFPISAGTSGRGVDFIFAGPVVIPPTDLTAALKPRTITGLGLFIGLYAGRRLRPEDRSRMVR